jgi:hypothetical protein
MQWVNAGFDSWTIDMITTDSTGTFWCVGTQGNVGAWDGTRWVDFHQWIGGWSMAWLTFMPILS